MEYSFPARLWMTTGDSAWHFVTLPHDVADDIEERTADTRRGFGSVRVSVTVGSTTWMTSLFPDTKAQSYVLPVKKRVRDDEGLRAGDRIEVSLCITEPG
jgi:hypothetical protein